MLGLTCETHQYLFAGLLLPVGDQIRVDVVPSDQRSHRRLFAESLQRDFRLQLSRVAPSLSWHSRFLLSDLDSTLASCPNFWDHLSSRRTVTAGRASPPLTG